MNQSLYGVSKLRDLGPKHLNTELKETWMKFNTRSFAVRFAVFCSLLPIAFIQAQEKPAPIIVVSHVDIKPDSYMPQAEETAAVLFRAETAATRQDAGLVSYSILQQTDATNHFTIVETWRDAKAYALHTGSDHTVQFRQKILPLLAAPFDARSHYQFR